MDVREVAAEEFMVGQAANRSRASFIVTSCNGDRIEILANHPGGRALSLHLGNDTHGIWMSIVYHAAEEIARTPKFRDAFLQFAHWHLALGIGYFTALVLDDVLENGNHRCYRVYSADR